jgi:hypothetical protein
MSGSNSAQDESGADDVIDIPNYSFKRKAVMHNGVSEQWAEVRYGEDATDPSLPLHVLEIRRVDMGDQFDLAEIAGAAVENSVWLQLAIVAMSVQSIDGTPEKRSLTKMALRSVLTKIGTLGVQAVREAVNTLVNGPTEAVGAAEKVKLAAGN